MKGKMLVKQTMAVFSACILCCAAFASCGRPISEKGSAGDTPVSYTHLQREFPHGVYWIAVPAGYAHRRVPVASCGLFHGYRVGVAEGKERG